MIASHALALLVAISAPAMLELARCEGCSCRGGPGYRAEDGKCVGWKELRRKCGDPPTTRCSDERDGRRSKSEADDGEEN